MNFYIDLSNSSLIFIQSSFKRVKKLLIRCSVVGRFPIILGSCINYSAKASLNPSSLLSSISFIFGII